MPASRGLFYLEVNSKKIKKILKKLLTNATIYYIIQSQSETWNTKIKKEVKTMDNTELKELAYNAGDYSAAMNTGDRSAATNTGDYSAATNTGNRSAATNTGDYSAATNTGYRSVATNTGHCSAATNTGYRSAAEVSNGGSVAIATGYQSKAKAGLGSAIVIAERGEWNGKTYLLLNIKAAIVDGEKIKADTWYTLINGEFVECD